MKDSSYLHVILCRDTFHILETLPNLTPLPGVNVDYSMSVLNFPVRQRTDAPCGGSRRPVLDLSGEE